MGKYFPNFYNYMVLKTPDTFYSQIPEIHLLTIMFARDERLLGLRMDFIMNIYIIPVFKTLEKLRAENLQSEFSPACPSLC